MLCEQIDNLLAESGSERSMPYKLASRGGKLKILEMSYPERAPPITFSVPR